MSQLFHFYAANKADAEVLRQLMIMLNRWINTYTRN